jgi:hypothetical protein
MPSKRRSGHRATLPGTDQWQVTADQAAPPVDEDAALDAMAELLLELVERDAATMGPGPRHPRVAANDPDPRRRGKGQQGARPRGRSKKTAAVEPAACVPL